MTVASGGRVPRSERMRRPADIRAVREAGVRVRGMFVTVYIAASDRLEFGVIAGRAVGIAVRRNRARRVLREALRALRQRFRRGARARVLLAARSPAADANAHAVASELAALLDSQDLLTREELDPPLHD